MDDRLTPEESRVLGLVERTAAERVEFLQELVRIPSPEGEGERIIRYVAGELERLGADDVDAFTPDVAELRAHPGYSPVHHEHSSTPGGESPVVVSTFRGAGGGRSLMIYGHMTSGTPSWEPAVVAKMRYDPWAATVADGRLYGRAAYNMKAGNAAGMMALHCIRQAGVRLAGDVLFNFNADEDLGSNGALASVLRGYTADGGINPEPTSQWICPTTGGPLWFRIEVPGRSAFAGWEQGISTIDRAINVYRAVQAYADERRKTARHPLYDDLPNAAPLAVGVFRAGNWPSNTPDVAVIEGRIGCLPGEDLDAIQEDFQARVVAAAGGDDWAVKHPPEVIWTARWEPVLTDPEHPIVTTAADVHRDLLGTEPVVSGKTAGNDMTKITGYGGVPSINWGPFGGPFGHRKAGTPVGDVGYDEFVGLDSYHTLTKLFALTLLRWCGVA